MSSTQDKPPIVCGACRYASTTIEGMAAHMERVHGVERSKGDTSDRANTKPLRELAKDGTNTDTTERHDLTVKFTAILVGYSKAMDADYTGKKYGLGAAREALADIFEQALTTKMEYQTYIGHETTPKREWWFARIAHQGKQVYGDVFTTPEAAEAGLAKALAELQAHHKQENKS